ncbi:MAG: glycosyltransferase [Thermoplasmata archaeon]|nr:glycosyltransferase [Thermoplasmata archaeon]
MSVSSSGLIGRAGPGRAPVDVLVRTYNSATDLAECLQAVRENLPVHCLIVIDHQSTDGTVEIAHGFGARVVNEETGLGRATTLAIELADTDPILFVDSDVILRRRDFFDNALASLKIPRTGAVVGCAIGHRFLYGLPLGLTLLPRPWALGVRIPPEVLGRETFYLQQALDADHLRVRYVLDAMEHRAAYRSRGWPEWQGAQSRYAGGWSVRLLVYSAMVIALLSMNSRQPRAILYSPIFFAKFLHGYARPDTFRLGVRVPRERPSDRSASR